MILPSSWTLRASLQSNVSPLTKMVKPSKQTLTSSHSTLLNFLNISELATTKLKSLCTFQIHSDVSTVKSLVTGPATASHRQLVVAAALRSTTATVAAVLPTAVTVKAITRHPLRIALLGSVSPK
jgi:hypothetical protein